MARPRKCRKICQVPRTLAFVPAGGEDRDGGDAPAVCLSLDEYEAIRLIDREGMSQEECGELMQVARTTVQQIYTSARRKLAQMLVEGRPLAIGGGDYILCDGRDFSCRFHSGRMRPSASDPASILRTSQHLKEDSVMKLAVTYENGEVFQHFGHTQQFKLYEIQDGAVVSSEVVDTAGSGHGALAGFLREHQADALICGGIGGGAQNALAEAGIALYAGVTGSADAAAQAFAGGTLQYVADAQCSHHGEHHGGNCHGEGHEGSCHGGHHGEGHGGSCHGEHHGEGHSCGRA